MAPRKLHAWLVSLLVVISGCQTSETPSVNEKDVLSSELKIVHNLLDEGRPEDALRELRPIAREHEKNAEIETLLGLTHLALRNTARATTYFESAYALEKSAGNALNLAMAYSEMGNNTKAITLLEKSLKTAKAQKYPFPERLYHNIGFIYQKLGQTKKAHQFYEKALEENPAFYLSRVQEARLFAKEGLGPRSRSEYEKAVEACPVCYDAVRELADSYVSSQQAEVGARVLRAFVANDNANATSKAEAEEKLRLIERIAKVPQTRQVR